MKGDTHLIVRRPEDCNFFKDKNCKLPLPHLEMNPRLLRDREANFGKLLSDIREQVQTLGQLASVVLLVAASFGARESQNARPELVLVKAPCMQLSCSWPCPASSSASHSQIWNLRIPVTLPVAATSLLLDTMICRKSGFHASPSQDSRRHVLPHCCMHC